MSQEIEGLKFPSNINYSAEHVWAKKEGGIYKAGITDFAQDRLGEIVYIDLPEEGEFIQQGEEFGTVESMKTISELFMPLSGEIVEVNGRLADEPEIVNQDPYGKGWMICIKTEDSDAVEDLLIPQEYINSFS